MNIVKLPYKKKEDNKTSVTVNDTCECLVTYVLDVDLRCVGEKLTQSK